MIFVEKLDLKKSFIKAGALISIRGTLVVLDTRLAGRGITSRIDPGDYPYTVYDLKDNSFKGFQTLGSATSTLAQESRGF